MKINERQSVLLVDDNEDLRDTTAKMIESFGYETILASNGNECLSLYEQFQPDLVLMDVKMPEKDGYDAFFELRHKYPDAKVIFMSAYNDFARWKEAKSNCAIYMIEKPYSSEFLHELIIRHINNDITC